MSENTNRVIENQGMLDLTGIQSPDELNGISHIRNIGAIIVPQSLMAKFLSIPQENIGTTLPIPDGKNVKVNLVMGPMQTSGEGLAAASAAAGDEGQHILVVMGPFIVTTPVEKVGYSQIAVMGPVFAPKGSESALTSGSIRVMGPIQFYPAGTNVKVYYGDTTLSGSALAAKPDDKTDTLVVMGNLLITMPVQKTGYKAIVVYGLMMAPKDSQDILSPVLESHGTVVWYTHMPRVYNGQDSFGAAFFELLKEPITLVVNGHCTIEEDVTVDLLRSKVADIVLNGHLEGPKHIVPLLQVLTTVKNGAIEVK